MTSTPQQPAGEPDDSTDVGDQDAEPTMNAPGDERPDAQETSQDGGTTDDVI